MKGVKSEFSPHLKFPYLQMSKYTFQANVEYIFNVLDLQYPFLFTLHYSNELQKCKWNLHLQINVQKSYCRGEKNKKACHL